MGVDVQTYRLRIGTFQQKARRARPRKGRQVPLNITPVILTCLLVTLSLLAETPTSPTEGLSDQYGPGNNNTSHTTIANYTLTPVTAIKLVNLQPYHLTRDFVLQQQLIQHGHLRVTSGQPQSLLLAGDIHPHPGPQDDNAPPILASDLPSGLKITQWNLRSIAPRDGNTKLDQLKSILHNPDKDTHILGVTETWLDDTFNNDAVAIEGYDIERIDRHEKDLPFDKDGAGGVLLYINTNLSYIRRNDLEHKSIESIWIELTPKNHPSHLICVAYRGHDHNVNDWLEIFSDQLTDAYIDCDNITVMGDFNINLLKKDADSESWSKTMENYQLCQLIDEPTRVTDTSKSLIDHIFTTNPSKVRCTKIPKIGISDHYPTIVVYRDSFGYKNMHTSIKYRSYKDFNKDTFLQDLMSVQWSVLDTLSDINEALSKWYDMFIDVVNKHAPLKEKRVKKAKQPDWMTDDILKEMSQRDHYKSIGDDVSYRATRNKIVDMIQQAKTEYYKTLIEQNQSNSKKLWSYLRELFPKDSKPLPSSIIDDDKKLTDPQDIANSFNEFFTLIVNKYIPNDQSDLPDFSKLQNFIDSKISPDTLFSIPLMSETDVLKLLSSLEEGKATGLDGVSAKLLKISAPVLAKSITRLLNLSIASGTFPDVWKTGKVSPIHKAGNKSDRNNFRPITVLCILSKILEKHVHSTFYEFLVKHCLLYLAQSGFRTLHSCETALNRLVDRWTTNMEKGLLNGVILVDLRKAFDLVDTDILLQKLSLYHCDENSISWFKSYLQGRKQLVQFKGKMSDTRSVTHGVPQGSILGPLLFILFMNDLPLYVSSEFDMYADDSTLHAAAKTVEELEDILNQDLAHVKQWCKQNRMVANIDKTKAMIITTYQKAAKLPRCTLNVLYDNVPLENVDNEKLLGVIVDKHLTWKHHVDKTCKSISKSIALLRRIKKYLPHQTRLTYYKAYIQPHLDYCNTVWGLSTHVSRIHILQKMALRMIMDVPRLTHSAPLFKKCGVLTIQDRVKFRTVVSVYKALNGLSPTYMADMFKKVSAVSKRTTRSSEAGLLYVPKKGLCVSRRAIRYSGATLFNSLNTHIQNCPSLNTFKCQVFRRFT